MNPSQAPQDAIRANPPKPVHDHPPGPPPAGPPAADLEHTDQAGAHAPSAPSKMSVQKKAILGGLGAAVGAACYFGVRWLLLILNTVSTDDAYVNGHLTFVAPRVQGQVVKVLVDDNYRVKKDQLLVVLDKVPFQIQVDRKRGDLADAKGGLANAKGGLEVAIAKVNGMIAQARSNRFKLVNAIQDVNRQIYQLKGNVDSLDKALPIRKNALDEFNRYTELMKTKGATTQQELDLKLQNLLVAKAQVRLALQEVYQIRAGLGLSTPNFNADNITVAPKSLAETPPNLDQTFSGVRQALADMLQSAAALGLYPRSYDALPKEVLGEFLQRDPALPSLGASSVGLTAAPLGEGPILVASEVLALDLGGKGALDRIFAKIAREAPTLGPARAEVEQAEAKVVQAQADLDQALLNLSYCEVRAEIDGVITRRNVNPGNNVKEGQAMMNIRSLTEIWIDANFKETQLANLRIGQHVKIEVDMYGGRREFEGRITGFTMGTGQTLALLPPQNATGNYVKIVQRLPVRIELNDYDPDRAPLFAGLSCFPYVYINDPLVGDDPGKGNFLQPNVPQPRRPTVPKP